MTQEIVYEGGRVTLQRRGDGIAVMRLSNPPQGFMDDASEAALEAALDAIDADGSLQVVVITGAQPGVFVRHFDVGVLEQRARALVARGKRFDVARPVPEAPIHRVTRRIEASDRIFIAAINGFAMGGGFELALGCDLRLAEDGDYRIGLPETNIGLLPGGGGTQRLTRLVGPGRALEWILLGRTFAPREAAELGLVNACHPGPVLEHGLQMAQALARKHPLALAHVKRLIRGGAGAVPDKCYADERTLFCDLFTTERTIGLMADFNASGRSIAETP
ncbi:MAG TPA: enoyl-CoA hydratase/isomerase family protein [Quisquiliibacterium sp.]|nr:enoyl-CoA hydratase/isomerase family protein [Quisquiliibacterium sp.]